MFCFFCCWLLSLLFCMFKVLISNKYSTQIVWYEFWLNSRWSIQSDIILVSQFFLLVLFSENEIQNERRLVIDKNHVRKELFVFVNNKWLSLVDKYFLLKKETKRKNFLPPLDWITKRDKVEIDESELSEPYNLDVLR